MPGRDIVVIGSSLGGVDALSSLVAQLPPSFPGAIFIVQHTFSESPGLLDRILSARGPLPAVFAEDGMDIRPGRIYIAPPDRHMILSDENIGLVFGPRENRSRPAIDPLFRTAAVSYRSRVIGVVLTGTLSDGASGLSAVHRCGGITVVQSPHDASYPEMPLNALNTVDVHYQVPLADLGNLLSELTAQLAPPPPAVPEELALEAHFTRNTMAPARWSDLKGRSTPYVCPDCGGHLRQIEDHQVRRYRCHVGHAFTDADLMDGQRQAIEEALWVAVRTLEERARMLETLAGDEERRGRTRLGASYEARAREARVHEAQIRDLLEKVATSNDLPLTGT